MADQINSVVVNICFNLLYLLYECAGCSCTYNILKKVKSCFFSRNLNNSVINDGADQITSVVNICFNLLLLLYDDARWESPAGLTIVGVLGKFISFEKEGLLWSSVLLSLLSIVVIMMLSQQQLKKIAGLLKDINENRLSKFELALGMTKIIEDFLEDSVQYNFVQHFYDQTPVQPHELEQFEERERERERERQRSALPLSTLTHFNSGYKADAVVDEHILLDNVCIAKCCCCLETNDPEKPTIARSFVCRVCVCVCVCHTR